MMVTKRFLRFLKKSLDKSKTTCYNKDTKGGDEMEKIKCKNCDFKSGSFIRIWYHLIKIHNIKLTKEHFKFMAKYCYCGQAVQLVVILLLLLILLVTYPFWWIHEYINDIL